MGTCPTYTVRLVSEAERLYVDEQLSCRGVVARLKELHPGDPAPSQEWVNVHLRRRGVLRDKSRADEIMNARRNGKDYDGLAVRAHELASQKLSVRAIARRLDVSRNFVRLRAPEAAVGASEATKRQAWETDNPAASARRARRARVAELRMRWLAGEHWDLKAIVADVGASLATVSSDLRATGLAGVRRPS